MSTDYYKQADLHHQIPSSDEEAGTSSSPGESHDQPVRGDCDWQRARSSYQVDQWGHIRNVPLMNRDEGCSYQVDQEPEDSTSFFIWGRSLIETETSTKSKNWLCFGEFLIWNVYQPNVSVYRNDYNRQVIYSTTSRVMMIDDDVMLY